MNQFLEGLVSVHSKLPQSCPMLCDPVDCSPPGSAVHGILQARILGRVSMPSSRDRLDPGMEPASPAPPALWADPFPHWGTLC